MNLRELLDPDARFDRKVDALMKRAGLVLNDHTLDVVRGPEKGVYELRGAHAEVEQTGVIASTTRLTATRMVLFGPFAWAMPKVRKDDTRDLYLVVKGKGWIVRRRFIPTLGVEVREYADRINRRTGT